MHELDTKLVKYLEKHNIKFEITDEGYLILYNYEQHDMIIADFKKNYDFEKILPSFDKLKEIGISRGGNFVLGIIFEYEPDKDILHELMVRGIQCMWFTFDENSEILKIERR